MNDAEWLREHLWEMHAVNWERRILTVLDENAQLREIVEALAKEDAPLYLEMNAKGHEYHYCCFCTQRQMTYEEHAPDCPYRRAREWVDDA